MCTFSSLFSSLPLSLLPFFYTPVYLYFQSEHTSEVDEYRDAVQSTRCHVSLSTARAARPHEKPRNSGHREHPPQDTKIVAGPSSWLMAWLGLALVGWLEVRTVVERLVGLEIAWWWVFVEVSEAPPWHLAASSPSRWGCKQQPCPCASVVSPLPCSPSADASSFAAYCCRSFSYFRPPGTADS